MKKKVLSEVFDLLHSVGLVSSEADFSRTWLCRSDCYMRTLRMKELEPGANTLAVCATKLDHYAESARWKHSEQIGESMRKLSKRCRQEIYSRAREEWMQHQ